MTLPSLSLLPSIPPPTTPVAAPQAIASKAATKRLAASVRNLFSESMPRRNKEIVAGGDIRWKPVDAMAARLLAKSPAINHPTTPPPMNPTGIDREKSPDEMNSQVAAEIITRANRAEQNVIKLANDAVSARALLDEVCGSLRADVVEFMDDLPKAIKSIRAWRMTITQERDLAITALQDIRKFFLGSDHEKEMGRLENFIRTCERLRSLAQDGTLEKVADVMLKLA